MKKSDAITGQVSFNYKDKLISIWATKSGVLESAFTSILLALAANLYALANHFKSEKGSSENLSQIIQNLYLGPITLFIIIFPLWVAISLCLYGNHSNQEKNVIWTINSEKIMVKDATGKEQFISWNNVKRFKKFPYGFLFKTHRWNWFWIPERTFDKISSDKLSLLASNKMTLLAK